LRHEVLSCIPVNWHSLSRFLFIGIQFLGDVSYPVRAFGGV
jgi:hypothetical protein